MPRGYELDRVLVKTAERIRPAIPRNFKLAVLDERGREYTTKQFAPLLNAETAFVIGGADGLPEALKKDAHLLLRLSSLTLAHALAQVVLVEQLYRAATLLVGHPYHRE
jgi:23S rRNA (pseudouridine1915-N3)-methyltransferase